MKIVASRCLNANGWKSFLSCRCFDCSRPCTCRVVNDSCRSWTKVANQRWTAISKCRDRLLLAPTGIHLVGRHAAAGRIEFSLFGRRISRIFHGFIRCRPTWPLRKALSHVKFSWAAWHWMHGASTKGPYACLKNQVNSILLHIECGSGGIIATH